jgi:hypothetical protein
MARSWAGVYAATEIADRNRSGVLGAVTGFVSLQPSSLGLSAPRLLSWRAMNGFGALAPSVRPATSGA